MNKIDIYKIWAPTSSIWSSWVRPVPFVGMNIDKEINEWYKLVEKDTTVRVFL